MLEGIHFSYDGIKSSDRGLINCQIDGGMFEETFVANRKIVETKVAGNSKPYFIGVEYDPLEFDLVFAFEDSYDERRIRDVAKWLNQSYYKPFYTVDNPNRIFYCMMDGDSDLIHTGAKRGYIKLKFRCDSNYSYQPITNKDNMDFADTKLVKSYVANTFNSGASYDNVKLSSGKIVLDNKNAVWSNFVGMNWSDIV